MKILKNQDPETSVTFEMRRRPLNAFPDIPVEFDDDLMQERNEGTLSRRVGANIENWNLRRGFGKHWLLL